MERIVSFSLLQVSPPATGLLAQKSWSPIIAGKVVAIVILKLMLPILMLVSLSLNGLCSCVQQSVVGSNPTQTALLFSWKRRAVLGVVDLFALPYLSTSIPSR